MFSKERLIMLLTASFISLPLICNVKENKELTPEKLPCLDTDYTQYDTNIHQVFFPKSSTEDAQPKLSRRQRKLMEKREQALAEIEARKLAAEQAKEEAAEENTEEKNTADVQEAAAVQEQVITPTNTAAEEAAQLEEKRRKEAELAALEAQIKQEEEAAQARKIEQERLQAQIEKELEKQKTASEKNKKEYLSDYMVYDFETVNDTDDTEEAYYRIPDPDERDASGRTLLMRSAKEGNEWELKQLLDSKADVNLKDSDGWTALMYAVRYSGSLECVEKLLEAGSDIQAKNNYGFSSLVLASVYNGNPKILSLLLESYKASDKEVLRALVFLLSEQNISERQQLTKLQIFMDKAVPLNILYEGKTPLMYAAKYGNSTKVLQVLLDNQASITMRSTENKTAFDYAMNNNNLAHNETYWVLNKK